jgi:hypothetical protein
VLLLVTNRDDLTADRLVLELRRRKADFRRFNTEDYPRRVRFSWSPRDGGRLRFDDAATPDLVAGDIGAVWWRRPLMPAVAPALPPTEARWAAGEALAALDGFWRTLDARWVNPPAAEAAADCKPEQLHRARALGFDVPDSLVTNDAAAARAFVGGRPSICKSLRDARVPEGAGDEGLFYTSPIMGADLADDDAFGPEPYLIQELVPKDHDVRVTVIGDHAYACRIDSQDDGPAARVDWRLGDVERMPHAQTSLPPAITASCLALTRSYGLRYAAIDLARRPDGGYTFFELNASGQWAWVEQLTGLPLAAALADELLEAR